MSLGTVQATETDKACLLGLLSVPELGAASIRKLVAALGSAEAAWHAPASLLKPHLPEAKLAGFLAKQAVVDANTLYEQHQAAGITMIALGDEDYPPMLAEIHNPPVLLFVKGSVSALSGKTLAIVGTRGVSEYGRQATRHLVCGMNEIGLQDAVIVSGLAAGVDSCAHWAAMENGYQTTAVFGCGLDTVFPAGNKKLAREIEERGGALVSEYPLGFPTSPYTFPQRNRIVAGLSHGVIVIEGGVKSGSLITARLASEEGRAVFAVPGNIFSPVAQGPNQLIQQGATAVTAAADILRDLGWYAEKMTTEKLAGNAARQLDFIGSTALGETEQKLLALIAYDAMARDVVFERAQAGLNLSAREINTMITMLELDGHVKTLPGNCICRL